MHVPSTLTLGGICLAASMSGLAAASQRVAICEEFTATWCTYCPSVAEALYNLQQDRPNDLIGMMIHGGDAYTTPWGDVRQNFYSIGGYPTVWLDGWSEKVGSSGSVSANYSDLNNRLNACLARDTDVTIEMAGEEISGTQYQVSGTIGIQAGGDAKSMRVQLIQCYDAVNWPESGELQFNTVRQAMTSFDVSLGAGDSHDFDHTFTLSGESVSNTNDVTYLCIVQTPTGSSPAQVHNAHKHDHGALPPANVTVGAGGDFASIQDAIANVGNGSTITVMPGTYSGAIDFAGRNVTVVSQAGAESTVIDANQEDTAVTIMSGEYPTLDGFTITGGYAALGSAFRINGNPTITNCIVRDNVATSNYCVLSSGEPLFSNNTFCNNDPNNIAVTWVDGGGNVFDDTCGDTPCDGDVTGDGVVNVNDILEAVSGFGTTYDVNDILVILENFGSPC